MAVTDSSFPRNDPSVTELLTSIQEPLAEEKGDSAFEDDGHTPKRRRIGLFWYTFGLLLALLGLSMLAGYWLLRTIDEEPRARENASRIVSYVTLARAGLQAARFDPQAEEIKAFALPQERIHLLPRRAKDRIEPFADDLVEVQNLIAALRERFGAEAEVASSVNGRQGLWISITANGNDKWWLLFDDMPLQMGLSGSVLLLWAAMIGLLILVGAALFVRLINRPLDALADAATHVREGDYTRSRLDESVAQTEVYEVNMHFNRMADQLARVEQERAQMLAGISHDLRTPLARLRLEIEMGVPDEATRERMSSDIEQVGSILNKFLDYARPSRIELSAVNLYELAHRCARPFINRSDMMVTIDVPQYLYVMADEVELGRAIYNLLENANAYGQTPGTGFTKVRIAATANAQWVKLWVRDYGAGVLPEQLAQLLRPFYRGDVARQNVAGTGLGLSIVARAIEAMGGQFRIVNANSGGLQAIVRLQPAEKPREAEADAGSRNRKVRGKALSSSSFPGSNAPDTAPMPSV
jgi:two-component system osmolarity sensor histidine kinase EnvZ